MLVLTERTPNPRTMKFLPGHAVADEPSEHVRGETSHPFLEDAFSDSRIESVFFGSDFVSVTVFDSKGWDAVDDLREKVRGLVARHALSFGCGKSTPATQQATEDVVRRIVSVIETRVRPAVAADGGDIVFDSFSEGVLTLKMRGACSGCPSAAATLRHGILNLMSHFVPEVRDVQEAA